MEPDSLEEVIARMQMAVKTIDGPMLWQVRENLVRRVLRLVELILKIYCKKSFLLL